MLAAVNHEDTLLRHAASRQREEPRLHVGRQRRGPDVEAELDRGRHLVDILATRARAPDEALVDLTIVEDDGVGDADQGRPRACFIDSVCTSRLEPELINAGRSL